MATHRKPRPRILTSPQARAAAGLTAALASVTMLGETASAAPSAPGPRPSISEVKDQVDKLYHEAESATDRYNGAKEKADQQRSKVDKLLDQVAKDTASLNEARRKLGRYAAEQYRTGGMAPATTLLLSENPQDFFDQDHLMRRLADGQTTAVKDFTEKQANTAERRREAARSLTELTKTQRALADQKSTVQRKLADARKMLSQLTEEERERLAALERKRKAEARERAEKLAAEEAARKAAEQRAQEQEQSQTDEQSSGDSSGTSSGTSDSTYAAKAEQAIAFARAQIGKPYVWGATGPNSYDCSGLTQAAWRAAGVELPRTTWDQVKVGQRVATSELEPGDLVFFYDDISHVGLYIGGGEMIHAPKPGDNVQISPITEMPIYGNVRPA